MQKIFFPILCVLTTLATSAQQDMNNPQGNLDKEKRSEQRGLHRIGPVVEYHLYVNDTIVNYTGRKRPAIAINGQIPAPTLRFTEGDSAVVYVHNLMKEEISVHWHGVLLPNEEDGVAALNTEPITAGKTHIFRFRIIQNGTLWYHSHTMLQEQIGLYGPLVFYSANKKKAPLNEEVLQISDWRDERPNSVLRSLKRRNDWYAIKKKGVQSWGEAIVRGHFSDKVQIEWMRMTGADVSDVYYNRILMQGQPIRTFGKYKKGDSIRLRVINGSTATYFWLQYSGGKMKVVAADGSDVKPVEVDKLSIAVAETYDIIIKIPDNGQYEFRATAQDITKSASAFFGSGPLVKAKDIPRLDYMVLLNEANRRSWAMKGMGMKMKMGLSMEMPEMQMNNMSGMGGMQGMDMNNMNGMPGNNTNMKMDIKGIDTMKMDKDMKTNGMNMENMDSSYKNMNMNMKGMDMNNMDSSAKDMNMNMDMQGVDSSGKNMKMDMMGMNHNNMTGMNIGSNMGNMQDMNMSSGMQPKDTSRSRMLMDMMPKKPMTGYDFPPGNGNDVVLSYDMLVSDTGSTVLPKGRPWREIKFTLSGNMQRYVWSINGKTLSEQDEKVLIRKGENVRLVFTNATMMEHPMHLHGHFFRVINKQGRYAPMKHTFNINPMGIQVIEFAATEEKDWFLHCHILYHMIAGMATILSYEGTTSQVQQAHPKAYKKFKREHGSLVFPWGDAAVHSQGTFGNLFLGGRKFQFNPDWRWNYKKSYDIEARFQYYLDKRQFFSAFLGAEFSTNDLKNGKPLPTVQKERVGTVGLIYTLPFLIDAEGRIDHTGKLRFQLRREDIALTTRTRLDFYWNTDKQFGLTTRYIIAKYLAVSANYDYQFGWGAGMSIVY